MAIIGPSSDCVHVTGSQCNKHFKYCRQLLYGVRLRHVSFTEVRLLAADWFALLTGRCETPESSSSLPAFKLKKTLLFIIILSFRLGSASVFLSLFYFLSYFSCLSLLNDYSYFYLLCSTLLVASVWGRNAATESGAAVRPIAETQSAARTSQADYL